MNLSWSRSALKAVAKQRRSGQQHVLHALSEVARLFEDNNTTSQAVLRQHYRDHALTGKLQGKRELHLAQNALLIYRINDETETVIFLDIITHEELRKRK